jgi:hypothetical protein
MGSFSSAVRGMATTAVVTTGVLTALPAAALAAPNSTFVACNDVTGPNGLIAAINAANTAGRGTIVLAPRCAYFLTAPDTTSPDNGLPLITGDITLKADDATIRRFSAGNFRIVEIGGTGQLSAQGITFAGGRTSTTNGGGILVDSGGNLRLSDSRVTQNHAGQSSGGIAISPSATARLHNTVVNNNTAASLAGGIGTNGNLTVVGGIIGFNTATSGGGVFAGSGPVSLTSTDIVHNTATVGEAGGLRNVASTVTVRRSNIQFNTAVSGGGGISNSGPLQVTDSRISDNRTGTAGNVGGGLNNLAGGTATVRGSTLTRNAAGNGGAVFEAAGSSVTVFRSLITNNHPNNCAPLGSVPGCSG